MRISDWSSDVCSSDLGGAELRVDLAEVLGAFVRRPLFRHVLRGSDELQHAIGGHGGLPPVAPGRRPPAPANAATGIASIHNEAVAQKRDRKSTRLNSSH